MITSFAVGATGPTMKLNGRNPTSHDETQIIGRINGTDNNTGGYTTRQSNLSDTGGGAFYGCRAAAATQNGPAVEPCVRANNLSTGLAFEFNTTHGASAGSITVGMIATTRLSTAPTSQVVQPRFDPPETTNRSTVRRPPASLARNSWTASMARTPLLTIARRTSHVSSFVASQYWLNGLSMGSFSIREKPASRAIC